MNDMMNKNWHQISWAFDGNRFLSLIQAQAQDWFQTVNELATCRDIGKVAELQRDFSERSMGRWTSETLLRAPTAAKTDKPAPAAAVAVKVSAASNDTSNIRPIKDVTPVKELPEVKTAPVQTDPDDLTMLKGIGPALAKKLNGIGITRFAEIAAMDADKIEEVEDVIGFKGRVTRDAWQDQARSLMH